LKTPGANELKGRFTGKRAFIIGNGPSLAQLDLDQLIGEYTFATGRIAMIFPETNWRPTYYVAFATSVNDYRGFPEYVRDAYEAMKSANMTFAYQDCMYNSVFHIARNTTVFLDASESEHFEIEEVGPEVWSDDIFKRVSKFGTSLFAAAQIAAYMGFNPIYFIGCDLGDGHFTSEYIPKYYEKYCTSQERVKPAIIRSHEIAKINGERLGVEFYNATLGGGLDVYPRVDYKSLFESETIYARK
jgi:hypothetical protein